MPARVVVFSTFFDVSAIGRTLVGLPNRMAAAPADKFPAGARALALAIRHSPFDSPFGGWCCAEFRASLPAHLRSLVDWELPLQDPSRAQSLAEQDVTLRGIERADGRTPRL